ncbi:hypothetical protein EMCG_02628 [[Emmonsia] crescens]|uniref:Uncharacterized protein n=1 Tax=[Emmonsia] crescens TaxID=73230 RepID=A0A0G2HXK0_9EURO|nr:hypothetical protein EMCG_02628 [Emmonsia crescens UAMH 3008]
MPYAPESYLAPEKGRVFKKHLSMQKVEELQKLNKGRKINDECGDKIEIQIFASSQGPSGTLYSSNYEEQFDHEPDLVERSTKLC